MAHTHRTGWWFWLLGGLMVVASWQLFAQAQRSATWQSQRPVNIDSQHEASEVVSNPTEPRSIVESLLIAKDTPSTPAVRPTSINWPVPFTAQAPLAIWDADHEEYCEEAAALMAGRYFRGQSIGTPEEAEVALQSLRDWQVEHWGFFESTTAEETAQMIRDVYSLTVELDRELGLEHFKELLAGGALILVPADGRALHNPYYKQPGPVYHMLVVRGYTSNDRIITNDPGTKHGQSFIYNYNQLVNAIGDYNNGQPSSGEKVVLVVSR